MGSPETEVGRFEDEAQHIVTIEEGYWIADTAVTQALWLAVVGGKNPAKFADELRCPVEQVSWLDVTQRFLPALNTALPGLDGRLPLEREFEYACREAGQAMGPFSFGDSLSAEQANFDGRYPYGRAPEVEWRQRTVPVDQFEPNLYGVFNLPGNVWEWCEDLYSRDPAANVPADQAERPPEAAGPGVVRGGSWFDDALYCRSARRYHDVPDWRDHYLGFRLARAAS